MKGWWQTLVLIAGLLVSSCTSTRIVPVEVHHTDTLMKVVDRWDSIYVHDSISIDRTTDTVRIECWHTKYIERWRHDTLRVATHDTVPQPYPVEVIKKVDKNLTLWQKLRIHVGGITIFTTLILLAGWLLKKKFKIF